MSKIVKIKCHFCSKPFYKDAERNSVKWCSLKCRFLSKVKKKKDGCWEWQGTKMNRGYGVIRIDDRTFLAHRVSYEIHAGKIPAGLWVCHHCDVPDCVNPDHFFLGTQLDNHKDCTRKGRRPSGMNHWTQRKDAYARPV